MFQAMCHINGAQVGKCVVDLSHYLLHPYATSNQTANFAVYTQVEASISWVVKSSRAKLSD